MAHIKADVIRTRNELLRLIGEQRDIYAGAIACLDNCKRMLLQVHDGIGSDTIIELEDGTPVTNPNEVGESTARGRQTIRDLASKMAGANK